MKTIKLTIAATETQCQSDDLSVCCNAIRRECCAFFGGQIWIDEEYKRLPECIAAEKLVNAPTEAQKEQRGSEG